MKLRTPEKQKKRNDLSDGGGNAAVFSGLTNTPTGYIIITQKRFGSEYLWEKIKSAPAVRKSTPAGAMSLKEVFLTALKELRDKSEALRV